MEVHNSSSLDTSNSSRDKDYRIDFNEFFLCDCIIVSSGVPLCAVAVFVLYSLVRRGGAPALVYVVNLLISDIFQICCLIVIISPSDGMQKLQDVFDHIHSFCLLTSSAFMACIAIERYLLVVWPLWYRFKRPTRISVVVCVLVWTLCAVVSVVLYFHGTELSYTIFSISSLLPIPLFLFCLGGTLRALSACRLPADKKRRIVAVLVLVLLIYTLLFLPAIISQLAGTLFLFKLPIILLRLNPLADLVLYVFMQKGAVDKLFSSVCCCKL